MKDIQKRLLLLAPPYMDIYKDIINYLESQGFEVIWVSDGYISGNPYNKNNISRHTKTIEQYQVAVDAFWDDSFRTKEYEKPFDFFMAIDGFMVTPHLFDILNSRNASIRKILYLFDRVEGNFEIDIFFKYYSGVYSFDLGDCAQFGLYHLPIYWVPNDNKPSEDYDIFGMAGFSWGTRYKVYKALKELARINGLNDYIKLYYQPIQNKFSYLLRYVAYKIQGKDYLTMSELKDDLFTDKSISPVEFRDLILRSKVILDTQNSIQDGMTARFMWALGAEKKIITTNKAVVQNEFYSPDQIYVLSDDNLNGVVEFISKDFQMSEEMRTKIQRYRIDNWVNTMLYG